MSMGREDLERARKYMVHDMSQDEFRRVISRTDTTCRRCTRCCIDYGIPEISKPAGVRCPYLNEQGLCDIYHRRPQRCRDFPHLDSLDSAKEDSYGLFYIKSTCPVIQEFIENLLKEIS
jgi:uncharacterized cysteine cluster protein YcgN (CxxCxxCC family)